MKPLSSARAASDTRHRIAAANSQQRRTKLVGLGSGGAAIVTSIDTASLRDVRIVIPDSGAAALSELADAEMIFVVLHRFHCEFSFAPAESSFSI